MYIISHGHELRRDTGGWVGAGQRGDKGEKKIGTTVIA